MGIGNRIKEAREALNLTQTELGKMVGVTGSAITNYEKETSHPKEQVIYKLMEALDVDANYLFQDMIKPKTKTYDITLEEYEIIKKLRYITEHSRLGAEAITSSIEREIDRIEQEMAAKASQISLFDILDKGDLQELDKVAHAPTSHFSEKFVQTLESFSFGDSFEFPSFWGDDWKNFIEPDYGSQKDNCDAYVPVSDASSHTKTDSDRANEIIAEIKAQEEAELKATAEMLEKRKELTSSAKKPEEAV